MISGFSPGKSGRACFECNRNQKGKAISPCLFLVSTT